MCTLSWHYGEGGYSVHFNRDERDTRSRAEAPELVYFGKVRAIAPRDPDHGGTWIAISEFGILTCLLNLYADGRRHPSTGRRSRGLLVRDLADCRSWEQTCERLRNDIIPEDYAPFQLLQFGRQLPVNGIRWDGEHLQPVRMRECEVPVTGSSYRNAEVAAERTRRYQEMVAGSDDPSSSLSEKHEAFHLSYTPEKGAHSVNMCRDDAQTVSYSRVDVGADGIRFRYREKTTKGFSFGSPMIVELEIDRGRT